ncbi:MAG: hypothetical protein NTY02_09245 [Acidobacteria bacterium]|nr:hypothetical protein [Acidobacteriota bacterium]
MALAAGASKAATYAATAAGLPQAFADLAGDLAALLAIGKGGKAVLDRIAQSKLAGRGVNVAERIAADAVTAVTKGRTSVLPADPTATVASPPPVLDDIVINAQTEGAAARLASVKVSDVLSPGLFDELAPAQRVEHATGLERDAAYEPVRGLPTLTIVDVAPITPAERPNAEAPIGPIEANAPIDTAVQYAPTIISAEPIPASDTDTMPVSTPGAMTTRTVHATDLTLSPQEYQFKESDATGQTGRLREVEQWDELQGKVSPVIVHELRDGRLMVVDGHQRVNLAHRLVREGKTVPMLDALVLRETDGWTAPDVRRQAALVNTRLNNASPIDIAKVVRESPLTPAETASIPRGNVEGERFAQAVELAKLSDVAFHAVVNGEIAPNFAQAVGRYVADPALQILAIRSLAKADLANAYQADRFVKELIKDADATETQQDMFGPQAVAVSLAKEKAQVVNAVANALRDQKSAFGNAFRNATRLEAAGNTLNRSANERMMSAAQRFAALLDSFADTTGATSRAITEAARNVHAGTSKPTDATDTIIAALETDFRAGRTETPGPSASGLEHTADGREAGDRGRGGADLQSEHAADAREESPPVTRAELESAGQSSLFGEDAPAEAVADRPVRFSPPTALPRFAPPATRQLQARVTRSRNAPRKTD